MEQEVFSVKPASLTQNIHNSILRIIVQNTRCGETQILNERRLSDYFQVSKAPVREALLLLCGEGILENIPRVGYIVKRITYNDLVCLQNLRCYTEIEALKRSLPNRTPEMAEQLERLIEEAETNELQDLLTIWDHNEAFHKTLASFANSDVLSRYLSLSMKQLQCAYLQHIWHSSHSFVSELGTAGHRLILEAFRSGDLDKAAEALYADCSWTAGQETGKDIR